MKLKNKIHVQWGGGFPVSEVLTWHAGPVSCTHRSHVGPLPASLWMPDPRLKQGHYRMAMCWCNCISSVKLHRYQCHFNGRAKVNLIYIYIYTHISVYVCIDIYVYNFISNNCLCLSVAGVKCWSNFSFQREGLTSYVPLHHDHSTVSSFVSALDPPFEAILILPSSFPKLAFKLSVGSDFFSFSFMRKNYFIKF